MKKAIIMVVLAIFAFAGLKAIIAKMQIHEANMVVAIHASGAIGGGGGNKG